MKSAQLSSGWLSLLVSLATTVPWGVASQAQAQPITAANDGTGTVVTPDGSYFHIHGGT